MKKIFGGKIYDSETATTLMSVNIYRGGNYAGNTTLMVTKKGVLFIYEYSNGQDCYRISDICPVNKEQAIKWMEDKEISDEEILKLEKFELLDSA